MSFFHATDTCLTQIWCHETYLWWSCDCCSVLQEGAKTFLLGCNLIASSWRSMTILKFMESIASTTFSISLSNHVFTLLIVFSFQSLPASIDRAVAYLEQTLPNLVNPYAVAMTSYALANEKKLDKEILYNFASPGLYTVYVSKHILVHVLVNFVFFKYWYL